MEVFVEREFSWGRISVLGVFSVGTVDGGSLGRRGCYLEKRGRFIEVFFKIFFIRRWRFLVVGVVVFFVFIVLCFFSLGRGFGVDDSDRLKI